MKLITLVGTQSTNSRPSSDPRISKSHLVMSPPEITFSAASGNILPSMIDPPAVSIRKSIGIFGLMSAGMPGINSNVSDSPGGMKPMSTSQSYRLKAINFCLNVSYIASTAPNGSRLMPDMLGHHQENFISDRFNLRRGPTPLFIHSTAEPAC